MDTICVVSKDEIPAAFADNFDIVSVKEAVNMWASACVAIGGDGTVLEAFRQVGSDISIAGLNTGHLGFLTNNTDIDTFIAALKNNTYNTIERSTLSIAIGKHKVGRALNEVVIYNSSQGSLADITIETGLNPVASLRYHCDALIISTATGSTAYNLSAGGSILDPSIDILSLTPVAPFSMSARPVVIGMRTLIIKCNHTATVSVDGKIADENIRKGDEIIITDGYPMETIHIDNKPFLTTIQEKLGWNQPLKFK